MQLSAEGDGVEEDEQLIGGGKKIQTEEVEGGKPVNLVKLANS